MKTAVRPCYRVKREAGHTIHVSLMRTLEAVQVFVNAGQYASTLPMMHIAQNLTPQPTRNPGAGRNMITTSAPPASPHSSPSSGRLPSLLAPNPLHSPGVAASLLALCFGQFRHFQPTPGQLNPKSYTTTQDTPLNIPMAALLRGALTC